MQRPSSPTLSECSNASSTDVWCKRHSKRASERTLTLRSRSTFDSQDIGNHHGTINRPILAKNFRNATIPHRPFVFTTFDDCKPILEEDWDNDISYPGWKFQRMDWFGTSDDQYCGQNVQLKYLSLPDLNETISLDVLHAHDNLHLPVDMAENIDELLTWIMAVYPRPALFNRAYPGIQFVCSRLEIDNVMSAAYLHDKKFRHKDQTGFIISAVKLRGKVYLSSFYTDDEKLSRHVEHMMSNNLQPSSIAGLMFQKNILSDEPNKRPDLSVPYSRKGVGLFTVEQFKTRKHSVLFSNKFKAVRSEGDLENLDNFKMFEVKTGFKPHKLHNLFRKWLRCFSGNMGGMIMGMKNRTCKEIYEIEEYSEEQLLQMCHELYLRHLPVGEQHQAENPHPQREVCVAQVDQFLDFVNKAITEEDTVHIFSFNPHFPGKMECTKLIGNASQKYRFISRDYLKWLNTQKVIH